MSTRDISTIYAADYWDASANWDASVNPNTLYVCKQDQYISRERSGSVVEYLTRDRRAAGSSLTGVTALCP